MGQSMTRENSKITSEDQMMYIQRKKTGLSMAEDNFIPAKELKKVLKAILKGYYEENLLQNYHEGIKKYINNYCHSRLTDFFMECISKILDDNEGHAHIEENVALRFGTPPSENKHRQNYETPIRSNTNDFPKLDTEAPHRDRFITTPEKLSPPAKLKKSVTTLCNSLCKFFEQEMMKPGNFFFGLADLFGKTYASVYEEAVKNFGSTKRLLEDDRIPDDWIFGDKVREKVNKTFERAKVDLKRFQNLQWDFIKAFLTEVSMWTMKNDSLVPGEKVLEQINLKLLFGRPDCYETFFTLARNYVLIDEVKLKSTIKKLKNLQPENFALDPMLCLENKMAPYQTTIESLNYLDTYASPYDKFQVIAKMRGQILKEIDKYWESSYEQGIMTKKLNLTADQLLPLHCYCLVSAMNEKMRAHQILIEEFVDEESLKYGEQSYYFTTFKVAIDFLVNISPDPYKGIANLNKIKNTKG